jgi:hypothetical protein
VNSAIPGVQEIQQCIGDDFGLLFLGNVSTHRHRERAQVVSDGGATAPRVLRGYGETDKPVSGYDKRNMARDLGEQCCRIPLA